MIGHDFDGLVERGVRLVVLFTAGETHAQGAEHAGVVGIEAVGFFEIADGFGVTTEIAEAGAGGGEGGEFAWV